MPSSFPHPVYDRHVLRPAYQDAQAQLFQPMLAAHQAHALMLAEQGIISPENAAAILAAVARIQAQGPDALAYQPGVEDLFFRVEQRIIQEAGPDWGGNLQLARSRNDLGQALARMALRTRLLAFFQDVLALRRSLLALAREHLETLMPGYTHTQPAQPTTFAHYLTGVLSFLAQDQERLARAYVNVNRSPLGAAAFTGTGFPVDRARLARLLGFQAVIPSTHHAIGAGDHLTDVAFALQSLALGLGRVMRDLLFLATREADAIRIHPSFLQISSIMPQKRNPVVLEHLRARLSRGLGYAQAVAIQCHNIPYGDTQDIEDEIGPPLYQALDAVQESVTLATAVFDTLELNRAHLARRAGEGFTTATELADALVREAGLPFRQAHQVVARLVQDALARGLSSQEVTLAMLQEAAQAVLGRSLPFTQEQLDTALDPWHFVRARKGLGGAAPQATGALLDELAEALSQDEAWLAQERDRLARAEAEREAAVARLLASQEV